MSIGVLIQNLFMFAVFSTFSQCSTCYFRVANCVNLLCSLYVQLFMNGIFFIIVQ